MYRILSSVTYLPDTKLITKKHKPMPKSLPRGTLVAEASKYDPHNLLYTRPEQVINQSVIKETIKTGNGRVINGDLYPQAVEPQHLPKKLSYKPDLFAQMSGSRILKPSSEIPLPLQQRRSMEEELETKRSLMLDRSNEYLHNGD